MDVVEELRVREAVRNPKGMEKAQTRAVVMGQMAVLNSYTI